MRDFFQVLESPEVNFRVGNEKGNMHPKGGTQRCCKPPVLDNLTKMVTLYSLLINNINDRLRTFTEQCLIVLWVFSPFFFDGAGCICVGCCVLV